MTHVESSVEDHELKKHFADIANIKHAGLWIKDFRCILHADQFEFF